MSFAVLRDPSDPRKKQSGYPPGRGPIKRNERRTKINALYPLCDLNPAPGMEDGGHKFCYAKECMATVRRSGKERR